MRVFSDFATLPSVGPSAVAIGNFDGVHLGHQALLRRAVAAGSSAGLVPVVLTFEPHPVRVLAPHLAPPLLCSLSDRIALFGAAGIEVTLAQRFDAAFAALSPEAFVQRVLVGALGARHVVVGYDFSFGARRAGTTEKLTALGAESGVAVEVVEPQTAGDMAAVSSTRIRAAVREGRLDEATRLLGRPYHINGRVIGGHRRGRLLGFPTANLATENELLPAAGVHAGWLDWGEGPAQAVVNLGHNPTFGAGAPLTIEAHVLGRTGLALYDRQVRLWFADHLRPERSFAGLDALRDAIAADCIAAAARLNGVAPPNALPAP